MSIPTHCCCSLAFHPSSGPEFCPRVEILYPALIDMKDIGDAIILIQDQLGYSKKIFKHELSIKMLDNKIQSILFSCYFIDPALHCVLELTLLACRGLPRVECVQN